MKITNKIILILVLFAAISILSAPEASAGLWDKQEGLGGAAASTYGVGDAFGVAPGQNPKDLRVVIGLMVQVFLGFLGFIFFFLIMVGGYKWMVSKGNESTITEAKSQMVAATVGLIIILLSFSIASFATRCFAGLSSGSTSVWTCVF